jgi:hypothetical protein
MSNDEFKKKHEEACANDTANLQEFIAGVGRHEDYAMMFKYSEKGLEAQVVAPPRCQLLMKMAALAVLLEDVLDGLKQDAAIMAALADKGTPTTETVVQLCTQYVPILAAILSREYQQTRSIIQGTLDETITAEKPSQEHIDAKIQDLIKQMFGDTEEKTDESNKG